MRFDVITLFPASVDFALSESVIGRARKNRLLEVGFVNPRDFSSDRHKTVDGRPYGGGPGMILSAEPLRRAIESVRKKSSRTYLLSPRGRRFDQAFAARLSREKHVVLVCGHYEGVDERISAFIDGEISIGDFILTGGEPAAAAVIDAAARLLPGVLGNKDAASGESFSDGRLEAPHYTRPAVWRGMRVPDELLSGNHGEIEKWRSARSAEITRKRRPDLRH